MGKRNTFIIMVCFIFITNKIFSQTGTKIIIGGKSVEQVSFYRYPLDNKLTGTYKDTTEARNECPEQLMKSILSCSNQKWEDYNTWGGSLNSDKKSEEYFLKRKLMNKEKNYMKLIHRVDYVEDSIPFSIIKFYLFSEKSDKIKVGVLLVKRVNNRWYKDNFINSLNTSLMMARIKSEILEQIFSNTISDDSVKSFFKSIYTEKNKIDLIKLSDRFNQIYNDENVALQKLVLDENAW